VGGKAPTHLWDTRKPNTAYKIHISYNITPECVHGRYTKTSGKDSMFRYIYHTLEGSSSLEVWLRCKAAVC
jgi:hypothetical protein